MGNKMNKPLWICAAADPADIRLSSTAEITIHAAEGESAVKRPSFSSHAYTGGELRVSGFPRPVIIDLNGLRASADVSILFDHDYKQVVGQAHNATINASGVHIAGIITGDSGAAGQVVEHARNGFKWPVSVGVSARQVQYIEEGKAVEVNGRRFNGPVYVARSGVLREVSFTGVGADEYATAHVAAAAAEDVSMTFEAWLEAHGFDSKTLSEKQRETLTAQYQAEITARETPVVVPAKTGEDAALQARLTAQREAEAVEIERVAKIGEIASAHPSIRAQAIREGWTTDKTENAVLRANRPTAPSPARRQVPADISEAQVLEAAMCLNLRIPAEVAARGISTQAMDLAHTARYRRFGLQRLMADCLESNGVHVNAGGLGDEMIRAALMTDPALTPQMVNAADGFSTLSFTGILSNIANKAMLAAYSAVASVVTEFAYETDTNDFKPFKRYRLTGNGTFDEIGAAGELKSTELQDEEYANQLKTFGRILTLTRQHIINDDLNAFTDIPRMLGRMAALAREKAVFGLLLANTGSFFAAGNKNLLTGAGSALSIGALTAATKAYREMKDAAGEQILITPRKILVPPALEVLAMQLNRDTSIIAGGLTNTEKMVLNSNPWAGSYKPVCSPYLGTAGGLTGGSDTGWYLLAEPSDTAAIQIGYLNGQRTPIIETAAADFATLGVRYRGYWDFGVAFLDKRAMISNAGV